MKVPWPDNRCILCTEKKPLTEEHLIPEALGGKLTSVFLCGSCNSKLGHQFESDAKTDPTIRLLVAELSSSIPALARDISEGQSFVSKGPGGSSHGRIKQGGFIVSAEKLADGSLIQPTNHGRNSIKKKLEKEQRSEIEIKDALYLFDSAQENTRIMLSPTLEAIKWTVETIEPSLNGALLNPIAPLKSAFEFLALHLGTAIYDNNASLTEVRSALIGNPINDSHIKIERLHAPIAKPFHGLLFEGNDPYAIVQVRLFGKLAFRVHFLHLSVGGSRYMYTHDLSKNTEDVIALDS